MSHWVVTMKIRHISLNHIIIFLGFCLPIFFSVVCVWVLTRHTSLQPSFNAQNTQLTVPTTWQLTEALRNNNSTDFWLSDLIETYFTPNAPFANLFNKTQFDAIKAKIASQMTNYALTQTTLSIEQAFLGLIANGYDAMLASQPSHSTYGIGFFLALRFLTLNETKGTKIIIDTIYRNDDISLSAYTMLLTHDKHPLTQTEDIHIAITPFNPKKTISQTGTTISILPILQDRRFSTELLKKIDDYIKPLSPDLPILITHGMHQEIRGTLAKIHENNAQGDALSGNIGIEVLLQPERLEICDKGTGISLETALTKLLIPWQSTKQTMA